MSMLRVLDISKAKKPLRFLAVVSKPYLVVACIAAFSSTVASFLETFLAYIVKKIIDTITVAGPSHVSEVWMWATTYVVLLFLTLVLWRVSGFSGMRWAVGVRASATYSLASYVTKHSSDYFHKRFAGAIGGKVGNTSEAVKKLVEKFLWSQLILVVTLITTIVLAFNAQPLIGWLFLLWLAIGIPLNLYLARFKVGLSATAQREDTRVRARVIDLLTNVGAMHEFARRTFELDSLKSIIQGRYWAGIRNWTNGEIARACSNTLQLIFVCGIMFASVYGWSQGLVTTGDIVLVLSLLGGLGYRMEELGRDINDFGENYGEIQEGLEDLITSYDIVDIPGATSLTVTNATVEFKNISFVYSEGGRHIVSDFNLLIKSGQKVGLVGKSGAGKSTLIKLLLRHYNVTKGSILIDGQDISQVTQESLREHIALVAQDPALFHRTIRENIAYGKLDATDTEVQKAARLAQAHQFIDALPQGYDTLVGERGVKLSGGERQRIALARAILKQAEILVLDEATSALDSENETLIQKALHELMQGKTVVAIAHRLSTLREMDRIVVLDGGKIIQDGSHEELLASGGMYADLWSHQSGGYLQDQ